MINKFQHFDVDKTINDNRDISGLILHNGIKVILISDKEINRSVCCVGVGGGYLHDEYEGTAHFLEHLLFMGSEKYPEQNEYTSYIQTCGGNFNAYTADYMTLYYLELDNSFFRKGVEMLSWFFKKPLLDMKYINSEREIINSEHEKNILDDMWIMDDVYKNFYIDGSKYKKFGTGNSKSLKGITKEDIFKYYYKYYTPDNLYLCIIDTKPIDEMIEEYVGFFDCIENDKNNSNKANRFNKDKIEYIEENLIEFKSVSEYNFLNIIMTLKCDQKNQIEFQLSNLISWLIGAEYEKSLVYFLKENNLIKNLSTSIDYYYDYECLFNAKFILTNKKKNTLEIILNAFNDYLNILLELTEEQFKDIYFNFQKIKMLKSLYSEKSSSTDVALDIVENMIRTANLSLAILRRNFVPEYKNEIYQSFKLMLSNLSIKLTTNLKISDSDKFLKSKWYGTKYLLLKYNMDSKVDDTFKFEIMNCIGIKNFKIKMNVLNHNYEKDEYPKLIYSNFENKRDVYYLDHNKYDNPLANISVIRYNSCISNGYNYIIMNLYKNMCEEIIKYYTSVMYDYKLTFNLLIYRDAIVYNFYGLNYLINNFVQNIIKMIHPDTIFLNPNISNIFKKIIGDDIEIISNSKYNSPYILCREYQVLLLSESLLPKQRIKFINNLDFNDFKEQCINCIKYFSEKYIFIGIEGFNTGGGKFGEQSFTIIPNEDIKYLIESISFDPKRYMITELPDNHEIKYKIDYTLKKDEINQNELNNCVIKNYILIKTKINYNEQNLITEDIVDLLIKNKIFLDIISDLINEQLFDQIRTIDKIGYIVRCNYEIQNTNGHMIYILYYLIQSTYEIKEINKCIDKFNKALKTDIKKKKIVYLEKIKSLIKSRLLLLEKPFMDLAEEVNTYLESFIDKIGIFDINKLTYKICKKINPQDILNTIISFLNNSETGEIILNKNKK